MSQELSPSEWRELPLFGILENLLFYMAGDEASTALFDALHIGVFTVVLDANTIIQDVCRHVRTGATLTGVLLAAKLGIVRFFCTIEVADEVQEHLPQVAKDRAEEALQAWRRVYTPLICVLDLSELEELSPRATIVAGNDVDDVPTAKLIDPIKPHAVLSIDRHLAPYEPAGNQWTEWSAAYRDKSTRDASMLGLQLGGGITISAASSAVKGLIDLVLKIDRRALLLIGLAIVLSSGVAIAHPVSREWLKDRVSATASWSSEHIVGQLMALLSGLNDLEKTGKEASAFLDEKQLTYPATRLARDYIAEALARTFVPLTAPEITERIENLGYEPRGRRPEWYVAAVLRKYPLLFQAEESHRWTLRSHADLSHSPR